MTTMAKTTYPKQLRLLKDEPKAHGGELMKTRAGRAQSRPLSTKESMHLVVRSTLARGEWSFTKFKNRSLIKAIVNRASKRYGVRIHSMGVVGNHIHFHLKLGNRYLYNGFIKSLTIGIAMAVTGTSRLNPVLKNQVRKFWDYRPFTRVVRGFRSFLNLKDYIGINQLEGFGLTRREAQFYFAWDRLSAKKPNTC